MDNRRESSNAHNFKFEIRISKEKDDEDDSLHQAIGENMHFDTLTANYRTSLDEIERSKSEHARVESHVQINRFISAGSSGSRSHSPKDFRKVVKTRPEVNNGGKGEVKVKISKNKCGSACLIF